MVFNLISLELSFFIGVMLIYTKLRKSNIFSISLVRGLTVYLPPSQADFDVLVKSNKPNRESAKGKVNKYDLKNNPKKAKFPMRTMPMNEELLQYCNVFFAEFDFLLMLFYYVLVMFVVMGLAKILLPEQYTQTNLTFYMAVVTLLIIWTNLGKNSFPTGYVRLTDETKV